MSFMDTAIDVSEGVGSGILGEVFQATASIVAESSSFNLETGAFEVSALSPSQAAGPLKGQPVRTGYGPDGWKLNS